MSSHPPRVGVVDIGTNSMRLLITDGDTVTGRWVEVTGLGHGVDTTGALSDDAMERTIAVFEEFGSLMDRKDVAWRRAIATSATRDASNRETFLDRAEAALGVRPEVIDGGYEGRLAFKGATSDLAGADYVISDIGGGSTEFVTSGGGVSIDIGSVRLTDRILHDRPPSEDQLRAARSHVADLFAAVSPAGPLVGVAGTWTSLAAIDLDLDRYQPDLVHGHVMSVVAVGRIVDRLAVLTVGETAAIPALDPKRAPVILAGSVIAHAVMTAVGADTVITSEKDSLDGAAMEVLGLR